MKRANNAGLPSSSHLHTTHRQGDREKVVRFIRQLPQREEAAQVMTLLEHLEADLPVRWNPPSYRVVDIWCSWLICMSASGGYCCLLLLTRVRRLHCCPGVRSTPTAAGARGHHARQRPLRWYFFFIFFFFFLPLLLRTYCSTSPSNARRQGAR